MSKVKQYYDDTADYYQALGINDRNVKIHSLLERFGLSIVSEVLEIGCGVGVQTSFLFKKVKQIVAIDLSEKSIALAKRRFQHKNNVTWIDADFFEIELSTLFDVILLADVLHYIPEEKYGALFQKLKTCLKSEGYILIHSPTAAFVEWCRANDASKLNIDDIAIENQLITNICQENELTITHYEQYSLWHRAADYQFWIIRHSYRKAFDARALPFLLRFKKKLNFWIKML
jgi:cyclopropane fatty-acyl-phospholipid synthase-like methyltransferase